MNGDLLLMRSVGKADACELLARAFAYPDIELAHALVGGAFAHDCASSLADAGCMIRDAEVLFTQYANPEDSILECTRMEFTRLYLNPAHVLVYPYESAFIHVESGHEGVPALFRTPITLDVESQMREAGVMPKNARKEPCDSVFQEFEFLSYLYGSLASAMQQEDADAEKAWQMRIDRFLDSHALRWMPAFMERTIQHSDDSVYGAFAQVSLTLLDQLASETQTR